MTKKLLTYVFCLFGSICLIRCQKDTLATGSDVYIRNSEDTVRFGTVFTTTPQVTRTIKLFNSSSNKNTLNIDQLSLAGGKNSPFEINVNGTSGDNFSNLQIADGDSLYIFITVKIPKQGDNTPLLNSDSIQYHYNGQEGKIMLYAVGQNVLFIAASTLQKDTIWTNELPIVLLGDIHVAQNATLHIQKGTRIFGHLKAHLYIDGSLQAIGGYGSEDAITFAGDRLDAPYDQQPGSWGGIVFGPHSSQSILSYVQIRNAEIGLLDSSRTDPLTASTTPNILLTACQVSSGSKQAIYFQNTSARLDNCLLYNSGNALYVSGGHYLLNYCTLTGYSNDFMYHTNPVLQITDQTRSGVNYPISIAVVNSIFYGDNTALDEIAFDGDMTTASTATFTNCLIKASSQPAVGVYDDCYFNADPAFVNIDNRRAIYDFHVSDQSGALGKAKPIAIEFDMEHNARSPSAPTIGCLEFKE